MCGASDTQKELQSAQTAFYTQMTSQYNTIFGQDQSILGALTASFTPILNAGINQKGFSDAELNNLNSQAVTGTGQTYSAASAALSKQQAAQGGGTSFIPSGAKMQEQQQLATSAAQNEAGIESNILASDYATGRQNYLDAASGLGGVAGQLNPAGFAGATTGAGSAAATTANEVNQADSSWMTLVGGALGAAGSALGGGSLGVIACPAEGSMHLMADGSERPVETLVVGDILMGIENEPLAIDKIDIEHQPVLTIRTENGFTTRNSYTHSFAGKGEAVVIAALALGEEIRTSTGLSKVIAVNATGTANVFNVITNGTHSYRADGVWAYGVGHEAGDKASEDYVNSLAIAA